MRAGDRVHFPMPWSTFYGMKGTVTSSNRGLYVLLDGDNFPIAVNDREVAPLSPRGDYLLEGEPDGPWAVE